jgi:hypothetical protein
MKSLFLFFLVMLSVSAFSQNNIVSVVSSEPLDSTDVHILSMLDSKHGELKAVVLIEVNGEVQEQKFIVRTQPCKCDPKEPTHYYFLTNDRRVVVNISDTSANLIVDRYDINIPDETAMNISTNEQRMSTKR